jgi:hypothetical protein
MQEKQKTDGRADVVVIFVKTSLLICNMSYRKWRKMRDRAGEGERARER